MGGPNCKFLSEIVGVATFYNLIHVGKSKLEQNKAIAKKIFLES